MNRLFIESSLFRAQLDQEKEEGFEKRVKDEILKDPLKGDIIPRTGGFRKIRLGKFGTGKRGRLRIIYLDVPEYGTVYLYIIIDKKVKVDLTSNEKKWLIDQSQEVKRGLKKQPRRKDGSKERERRKK